MATITEQLVWASDVSNTGVTNPGNTVSSNDSRNTMAATMDWTFELTNLTYTPTSITSIKPYFEGRTNGEGGTHVFYHKILNGSSSELYSEAATVADNEDGAVQSYATRTTSDGSSAWTENDINTLRIRLDHIAFLSPASEGQLDHYYMAVTYDYDPPPAGKVTISAGKVTISDGKIRIKF